MAGKSPAQDGVARPIEFSPLGRARVQVTFDEPELSEPIGLFRVFLDAFLDSYAKALECMIIDMVPTVNRVHGDQLRAVKVAPSRTARQVSSIPLRQCWCEAGCQVTGQTP